MPMKSGPSQGSVPKGGVAGPSGTTWSQITPTPAFVPATPPTAGSQALQGVQSQGVSSNTAINRVVSTTDVAMMPVAQANTAGGSNSVVGLQPGVQTVFKNPNAIPVPVPAPVHAPIRALNTSTASQPAGGPQPPLSHFSTTTLTNITTEDSPSPPAPFDDFGPVIELTGIPESMPSAATRGASGAPEPLARKVSRKHAARVSEYDSANIARNILLIAKKHPTERALNEHLLGLRVRNPVTIPWNADLSTIRWDILDPEPVSLEVDGTNGIGTDIATATQNGTSGRISRTKRSAPSVTGDMGVGMTPTGGPKQAVAAPNSAASSATASRRLRTSQPTATGTSPSNTVALGHPHPHQSSLETNMETTSKRRRLEKAPAADTPAFKKFPCEWEGCRSDLHNIEGLKKHYHTHAKKARGKRTYRCEHRGCSRLATAKEMAAASKSASGGPPPSWFEFETLDAWKAHMDSHTDALKEKMGWGPGDFVSGSPTQPAGSQSTAATANLLEDNEAFTPNHDYLSDHFGRQITPRRRAWLHRV